eukprot:2591378-Alexandrium_andersonii.AAC.1
MQVRRPGQRISSTRRQPPARRQPHSGQAIAHRASEGGGKVPKGYARRPGRPGGRPLPANHTAQPERLAEAPKAPDSCESTCDGPASNRVASP